MEKHPCRICSKSFPTGRSLGGHMRSHICSYTAEEGKKKLSGQLGGCSAGYGRLRENPKKLWRVSDLADDDPTSSSSSLKWKQCRECGKVFPSSKALFGHLRCHSSKICRRSSKTELKQEQGQEEEEDGSWSGQKFSQESISDNNAPPAESGWNRRSNLASAVIQVVAAAASSSITTYEQEQEEVAISLMMLSRDLDGCSWAPASESSDKHSMVFEKDDLRSEPGDFDCEYTEEADYSGDEPKRKKTLNLAEFGKKTATIEEKGHCFNAYESKWGKTKSKLESAYQCTSCSRSFHSYQALGGHRASHKRIKTCCLQKLPSSSFDGTHESNVVDQLTFEIDVSHSCQSSKSRIHKCSICEKTFSSGQALGGHKRSHLAPNADAGIHVDNNKAAAAASTAVNVPELLDLNFPAPIDEEFSNVKPWRTFDSISHEHQHLVDFISN